MSKDKNKSLSRELLRFLVTGIVCALLDFFTGFGFGQLCGGISEGGKVAIMTTTGFVVGVIANYLLSTYWVFKNVKDEKSSKKPLFIAVFVVLSAGALGISVLTMWGCQEFCKAVLNLDISDVEIMEIFKFQFWGDPKFWGYFISFGIRTLVGMVWNYLTRKFILYKAPKEESEVQNGD